MEKTASIFRTRAHNTALDSENKIHDDSVAAAYGFRGGLVPGVTVYGYMVPAIIEALGHGWIAHGSANVRFHLPCYEGENMVARCTESEITAEREDGSVYASGTVGQQADLAPASFPAHPLPDGENRPLASSETITTGLALGTVREILDVLDEAAIPERLLRMANEILVRNFRMSPWIHAGSYVSHHQQAIPGQEITVTGVIEECFERKGRKFAVAGLAMSTNHQPVASVRHTFIYKL